jgi:hypothetical protein
MHGATAGEELDAMLSHKEAHQCKKYEIVIQGK